ARATVESVAENSSDAEVAPLVWGALAGVPGLVGYRAVNTLDAMVGHRSARYRRFGTAAARLDDVANLAPARLTAALTVVAARVVGGSWRGALRTWLRDGGRHPSPNAGRCEAAMAGALGIRLGGRNVYGQRVEQRPTLGDGRTAKPDDIRAAACGLEPSVRFNPVLLKPGSDHTSQVVLRGRAIGSVGAGDYARVRQTLAESAFATLAELRREFDVVVCEGAGSPAEINLRDG